MEGWTDRQMDGWVGRMDGRMHRWTAMGHQGPARDGQLKFWFIIIVKVAAICSHVGEKLNIWVLAPICSRFPQLLSSKGKH